MKLHTMIRPILLCVAATLVGASANAHHSTAMFEWGKEKTLEGTIDKYEWTQPHAFIWLDVAGKKGKIEEWGFEGMSPSWLGRNGWSSRTLKAGDKIKVSYFPLRDGRTGGFFVSITLPDGRTLRGLPGGNKPPS